MNSSINEKISLEGVTKLINGSQLASIKESLIRIIDIINDPNAHMKDLIDTIRLDPPLSVKILRVANSAYFGRKNPADNIRVAIIRIGFNIVKELALSLKINDFFVDNNQHSNFSMSKLWENCVAVAIFSKLIMRREFRQKGEKIYASGLLHNIGIVLIKQFLEDDFSLIVKKYIEEKIDLIEIENPILGFTHADLSGSVLKSWGFPSNLYIPIQQHHRPLESEPEFKKSAMVLYIANYCCAIEGIGFVDLSTENNDLFVKCLENLNITEKATHLIMHEVRIEMKKLTDAGWFK